MVGMAVRDDRARHRLHWVDVKIAGLAIKPGGGCPDPAVGARRGRRHGRNITWRSGQHTPTVIPGRPAGPNPESTFLRPVFIDPGLAAARRPGMTGLKGDVIGW